MAKKESSGRTLLKDQLEAISVLAARKIFGEFTNLRIGPFTINAPYWRNNNPELKGTPLFKYVPRGGKMSPQELIHGALAMVQRKGLKLDQLGIEEISKMMSEEGLGADCSGFVYQVCENVYKSLGGKDFKDKVVGFRETDTGISRVSANDLTSPKNSENISDIMAIEPGDLIRCYGGRHVMVIIECSSLELYCAHSHDQTEIPGVHGFTIKIIDPKADIFHQEWDERMTDGSSFQEEVLENFKEGDGIWRLRIIDDRRILELL